jgi:hypothetical protein
MVEFRMTRADARAVAEAALARLRRVSRRERNAAEVARWIEQRMFDAVACGALRRSGADFIDTAAMLAPAARTWFVTMSPETDVLNGGFWQYFGNGTSDLHTLALAGFEVLGAAERAELFSHAGATLFGTNMLPPHSERLHVLERAAERGVPMIRTLDDRYVALSRASDLAALLVPFARARENDFFVD